MHYIHYNSTGGSKEFYRICCLSNQKQNVYKFKRLSFFGVKIEEVKIEFEKYYNN